MLSVMPDFPLLPQRAAGRTPETEDGATPEPGFLAAVSEAETEPEGAQEPQIIPDLPAGVRTAAPPPFAGLVSKMAEGAKGTDGAAAPAHPARDLPPADPGLIEHCAEAAASKRTPTAPEKYARAPSLAAIGQLGSTRPTPEPPTARQGGEILEPAGTLPSFASKTALGPPGIDPHLAGQPRAEVVAAPPAGADLASSGLAIAEGEKTCLTGSDPAPDTRPARPDRAAKDASAGDDDAPEMPQATLPLPPDAAEGNSAEPALPPSDTLAVHVNAPRGPVHGDGLPEQAATNGVRAGVPFRNDATPAGAGSQAVAHRSARATEVLQALSQQKSDLREPDARPHQGQPASLAGQAHPTPPQGQMHSSVAEIAIRLSGAAEAASDESDPDPTPPPEPARARRDMGLPASSLTISTETAGQDPVPGAAAPATGDVASARTRPGSGLDSMPPLANSEPPPAPAEDPTRATPADTPLLILSAVSPGAGTSFAASAPALAAADPPLPPWQQALRALAGLAHLTQAPSSHPSANLTTDQPGRIELTLAPETLGRLHFDMRPEGAGLSITLSAERAETLDLMRRHLPELAAELKQLGIQAGSFSFGGWSDGRQPRAETTFDTRAPTTGATPDFTPPAPVSHRPMAAAGALDLRI